MNSRLHEFTRAIASGVSLLRIAIRSVLPNLYTININPSTEETPLIYDGNYPYQYPQAYGEYLDLIGSMFGVSRNVNEEDDEYRRRIIFSIQENSTIAGIESSIQRVFQTYGIDADVEVRENYRGFFDGVSTTLDTPIRDYRGSLLYGLSILVTPRVQRLTEVTIYDFITNTRVTHQLTEPWRVRKNISVQRFVDAFRVPTFRHLVDIITASGIRVDRVIIQDGKNKGNIYTSVGRKG